MTEKGRILPAKDIHRAAKEVVKNAKKRDGRRPECVVMNREDLDDVCNMLKRSVMTMVGVPIKTLPTMPRGKLGLQWKEEDGDEVDEGRRGAAENNEGDAGAEDGGGGGAVD